MDLAENSSIKPRQMKTKDTKIAAINHYIMHKSHLTPNYKFARETRHMTH